MRRCHGLERRPAHVDAAGEGEGEIFASLCCCWRSADKMGWVGNQGARLEAVVGQRQGYTAGGHVEYPFDQKATARSKSITAAEYCSNTVVSTPWRCIAPVGPKSNKRGRVCTAAKTVATLQHPHCLLALYYYCSITVAIGPNDSFRIGRFGYDECYDTVHM